MVALARVEDLAAEACDDQFAEPLRQVEHQVFLAQAGRADRARVTPPMARIDHDLDTIVSEGRFAMLRH